MAEVRFRTWQMAEVRFKAWQMTEVRFRPGRWRWPDSGLADDGGKILGLADDGGQI